VLYNEGRSWRTPLDLAVLIASAAGRLDRYGAPTRQLLADEQRHGAGGLPGRRNLVAAVYRLEHSGEPEEVLRVMEADRPEDIFGCWPGKRWVKLGQASVRERFRPLRV